MPKAKKQTIKDHDTALVTQEATDVTREVTFDSPLPVKEKSTEGTSTKPKKTIIMPTEVTPATFASIATGKTPLKVKRAIDKGTATSEIKERWENCTGIPLRVHKFTKSGNRISRSCAMCNGSTSWYCIGCKSWFCMDGQDTNTRQKTFVSHTMTCKNASTGNSPDSEEKVMGEDYVFELSCFHQKHQAAWERAEGKERLEDTKKKLDECAANLENLKGMFNV
eukprot:CAMPEP_0204625510 /NCGR_PEP_ID=MMETSP0717-20131115/11263_1 /ASSEMBLY_ACC=CAM_ASM_000666 /TAXON_ID=230516 /ORGANISM="Chaetoceros curvisetus" /LENGTH=222 /DNA_ID=CAMNT_0051641227 /DNA_START=121 /DNA_END=789 /DNA_ORIENTATION=-